MIAIIASAIAVVIAVSVVLPILLMEEKVQRVADERNLTDTEYTVNSITATDALGRYFAPSAEEKKEKYVGMFYFLWLGQHQGAGQNGIYNISELLENDPDSLWDISASNKVSPTGTYHHWGEPLFGYYNSTDEWVIRKHIEMFSLAGIDFLCFDTTNGYIYKEAVEKVLFVLDDYRKQGWDVPQVMFYTNTNSGRCLNNIYSEIYVAHPEYSDLWFAPHGKPMIVGVLNQIIEAYNDDLTPVIKDEFKTIYNYFEIKDSQWPNENNTKKANGFPWIEFSYPQYNHGGVMNVSVAQHTSVRMSNMEDGNWGRGYNHLTMENDESLGRKGINYDCQWQTVYDNGDDVEIVHITGWNEWIAIKMVDSAQNKSFFVDTFNENYSRDIEPMKGGYGDNFYLQTIQKIRNYKYSTSNHYEYKLVTPNGIDDEVWQTVPTYKDFVGDCAVRDSQGYYKNHLTDNSGRNDVECVKIAHDDKNLYIKISCNENITAYDGSDENWMNVYIGTGAKGYKYGDYNFIINRKPNGSKTSVEKINAFNDFSQKKEADMQIKGKDLMITVSLKTLGLKKDKCAITLKVADNIMRVEDFSTFYTTGDCAPYGRLSYSYGY